MTCSRIVRCVAALAVMASVVVPLTSAEAAPVAVRADDGARVTEEIRVDARTVDLRVESPALGTSAWVRLLVPRGWDADRTRAWPTLWLLHGCCADVDYKSWTEYTDVEAFVADKDVLVVLPSDGRAGMYSAWWNFGMSTKPDWEAFHLNEVRQIVERGYGAGAKRSVAGLSIGGYGALAYSFRHLGMFAAAASYSGVPNTMLYGIPNFIQTILMREGLPIYNLWGNEFLQRAMWTARNPYDNVDALRGVRLYVSSGNGSTGPLDKPGAFDMIEPLSYISSRSFTDRLKQRGIAVTTNYYGNGTHTWPYWERELHASWPTLAAGLGLPA